MSSNNTKPVLLLGGSGSLGANVARLLRAMHPELPLAIAGRDAGKAELLAAQLGNASVVRIDLARADLGLEGGHYRAVVACLKDHSLNAMKYAQADGIPYVAVSEAVFEIGPLVARSIHRPERSPVLMLGHSIGAVPMLASLFLAREFRTVDTIAIGLVFDPDDTPGPMTVSDMERIMQLAASPLLLKDGKWVWTAGDDARRRFTGVGGVEHQGQAAALVDTLSLASLDGLRSARVDIAEGRTASSRRGDGFSHEVIIEITGERRDGTKGRHRYELVDRAGYAAMSAKGIAACVERLLGLDGGEALPSGLYLPEMLADSTRTMKRLEQLGVTVVRS